MSFLGKASALRSKNSPVTRVRDWKKGGNLPFDPVLMFKLLVLQKCNGLSDGATEEQIFDRTSFKSKKTLLCPSLDHKPRQVRKIRSLQTGTTRPMRRFTWSGFALAPVSAARPRYRRGAR